MPEFVHLCRIRHDIRCMPGVVTGAPGMARLTDIPTLLAHHLAWHTWKMANRAERIILYPLKVHPFEPLTRDLMVAGIPWHWDPALSTNQSQGLRETDQWGPGEELSAGDGQGHRALIVPHQSRLAWLAAAAACFERDPHCSTVLCTVYTCTVYCAVITVTSQLVPGYRWPAQLTQADFTKVRKLSFFRHVEWLEHRKIQFKSLRKGLVKTPTPALDYDKPKVWY